MIAGWCLAHLRNKKTRRASKKEEQERKYQAMVHKFSTSAWKFVSYSFFVGYGAYALSSQTDWLWEPTEYQYCFADNVIPSELRLYYTMAIAYYMYSCISIAFEPKMKDRRQMTVHHAVTLTLLATSLLGNVVRYGLAILMLHDLADPWMEIAKISLYSGFKLVPSKD